MKKVLFSLLAVMFVMASCGGADPVKFNDAIVNEQKALTTAANNFGVELGKAMATQSFDGLNVASDSLVAKMDKSIETIKGLSTPSGGEKFKEAAIDAFEFQKKQILSIKDKATTITPESSVEDVNSFIQLCNDIMTEAKTKEEALIATQKEFAKEKNIMIR